MSHKKVRPLGDRILVKRSKLETVKGNILLPETAQEKPKQGEVLRVGPGSLDKDGKIRAMSVKEGDRILFSSYSGTEVQPEIEGSDYLIIAEDDVLAIIE